MSGYFPVDLTWLNWSAISGYTGPLDERVYNYLGDQGYTGDINERMYNFLGDLSYTGSISERMAAYVAAGLPTFAPDDIEDLVAWYDSANAASITTSGDSVTAVTDRSGNGHDLEAGSTGGPDWTSTTSGFIFTVDNDDSLTTGAVDSDISDIFVDGGHFFHIINPNIAASDSFCRFIFSNGSWKIYQASDTSLRFIRDFNTEDGEWDFDVTPNTKFLIDISYDDASVDNDPTVNINGSSVSITEHLTPVGTAIDVAGQFFLGGQNGIGNLEGIIYETVLYSSVISGDDYDDLTSHLINKWNIS